jgi:hypothetical protein
MQSIFANEREETITLIFQMSASKNSISAVLIKNALNYQ